MKTKGAKNKKGVSRQISIYGYVQLFKPEHPVAQKNGYVMEHRMIAYDSGLLVDLTLEVHHKNGDKTDNRIENLEVLPKNTHTSVTWKGKKRGEWSESRRKAKSDQMKGNKHWAGKREPNLIS